MSFQISNIKPGEGTYQTTRQYKDDKDTPIMIVSIPDGHCKIEINNSDKTPSIVKEKIEDAKIR